MRAFKEYLGAKNPFANLQEKLHAVSNIGARAEGYLRATKRYEFETCGGLSSTGSKQMPSGIHTGIRHLREQGKVDSWQKKSYAVKQKYISTRYLSTS